MKNLTLLNDNTNIKLNDTGTVIQFKASNEGQPVGLSNGQSATFRIKNELGFLKSVQATTSYGGYVFELDTSNLSALVPDTYQVELLVQVDSDDALIFPNKGFVQFTINANALNITGEQLPVMSLEDFKDELKTYVTNQTTQATSNIKNDFDTYVDNLTDSTITTATKASQDATNAINTANTAKNTADTAKSTADTAKSTADSANTKADANASLIKEGVFLQLAKSFAQVNTSQNLIVNSDMLTDVEGGDPASPWQEAYGWSYANGSRPIRSSWHGGNSLKLDELSNTNYLVSSGIYTGKTGIDTTYSSSFIFDGDGTLNEGDTVSVFIEFAYQADFKNSQKVLLYEINSSNYSTGTPKKENFKAPYNYNWARLRVECNISNSTYFIWLRQPLLNIGGTCITYRCSESAGQRILDIENQLASMQQAQAIMLTQMATIQSNMQDKA